MDDLLAESLAGFLDRLAAKEPAPGGGAAAATAVAMAAGLVAMSARFSAYELDESTELIARAEALRARSVPLAQADAEAYGRVLDAFGIPKDEDPQDRRQAIRAALSTAAEAPLAIARIAAEVATLAAQLAESGNSNLRGDAVTAGLLAEAGGRSAAVLVAINLSGIEDDRSRRAQEFADTATAGARRALAALA